MYAYLVDEGNGRLDLHLESGYLWEADPSGWDTAFQNEEGYTVGDAVRAFFAGRKEFAGYDYHDILGIKTDPQNMSGESWVKITRERSDNAGRMWFNAVADLETHWISKDDEEEYFEAFITDHDLVFKDIDELREALPTEPSYDYGTDVVASFTPTSFEDLMLQMDRLQMEAEAHDDHERDDFLLAHGRPRATRRLRRTRALFGKAWDTPLDLHTMPARAQDTRRIVRASLDLATRHGRCPDEVRQMHHALRAGRTEIEPELRALRLLMVDFDRWRRMEHPLPNLLNRMVTALSVTHSPQVSTMHDGISPQGTLCLLAGTMIDLLGADGVADRGEGLPPEETLRRLEIRGRRGAR